MSEVKTLTVTTRTHDYPIHIGYGLGDKWSVWLRDYKKGLILIDETVASFWEDEIVRYLEPLPLSYQFFKIPAGEASKSFDMYQKISCDLLNSGVDRQSAIMAIGGGVTGDLAGFIASTLLRGVPFIQVPTTLLSQVDSSVGGKTAINVPEGKNLIGSFYPPHLVIIDLAFLSTLPDREMKAGYAEILKYGLIYDKEFLHRLYTGGAEAVFSKDPAALIEVVSRSCQIKAEVVSQDECEQGVRAILNFGHTFAHVFEAGLGYDGRLVHGEAVAIGMRMALALSVALGDVPQQELDRLIKHYDLFSLPKHISDIVVNGVSKIFHADSYLKNMYKDKKVKHGALTLILLQEIGRATVRCDVDDQTLLSFLKQDLKMVV